MKVFSIDLGGYKVVAASSDTSAGEILLDVTGGRSIKTNIDYRGKKRSFGIVGSTFKQREKVAERVIGEIEQFCEFYLRNTDPEQKKEHNTPSHVYGLLTYMVNNYLDKQNSQLEQKMSVKELEMQIALPSTYTVAHQMVLSSLLSQIGVSNLSFTTDSQALCAYYLSKRAPSSYEMLLVVDIGDTKTTGTLSLIKEDHIKIISRETVGVAGSQVSQLIADIAYKRYIDTSDLFPKKEFSVRNEKSINWIKSALSGLPEVSSQIDITHEASKDLTVSRASLEAPLTKIFEPVKNLLISLMQKMKNYLESSWNEETEPELTVEVTGGSSRLFFVQQLVEETCGKRPHFRLNSDESVALGGLYRGLMDSIYHRFRYDPLIEDILDHPYTLRVEHPSQAPRVITLFKEGSAFLKEPKSEMLKASYSTESPKKPLNPLKSVKVTKIFSESQMTICAGNYPIYVLKQLPEQNSSETGRTLKFSIRLNGSGGVTFSSEELEFLSIPETIDFSIVSQKEQEISQKEKETVLCENMLNAIQTSLFDEIQLLSDSSLSEMPSAQQVVDVLWEHTNTLPANASTEKQVKAWETKIIASIPQDIQKEWQQLAEKLTRAASETEKIALIAPEFPGILHLFDINEHLNQQVEHHKEEERKREEQRQREEQRRREEALREEALREEERRKREEETLREEETQKNEEERRKNDEETLREEETVAQ
ncbi:hypothetical protein NEFER03_0743 [Nematocida sp. LUAm3]|nr:hypothetical protein NEFER03_0743 [Nematocida sp. LUAm3]KAI5175202.1 hypothetical protein NEFER02_1163 [Nematocida sp. LUAm2]KAI5178126.1 hypothetical protein NEFER01_1304 [Nematocida sp. LUAm1]